MLEYLLILSATGRGVTVPRRIWLVWRGDDPPNLELLLAPEEEELYLLPEATLAEAARRREPG